MDLQPMQILELLHLDIQIFVINIKYFSNEIESIFLNAFSWQESKKYPEHKGTVETVIPGGKLCLKSTFA